MSEHLWYREGLLAAPCDTGGTAFVQCPTVLPLRPDRWRIYYAGRDATNTSTVRALDVDPRDMTVVERYDTTLLELGEPGAFDRFGLGPSCAVAAPDGGVRLYYTGIVTRSDVAYELAIGVAFAADGLHFEKTLAGPVLAKGPYDPYFASTPCVRATGANYEMWYVSGTQWIAGPRGFDSRYNVRRSRSRDGIIWDLETTQVLDPRDLGGTAIGRPWVAHDGENDRLWFSLRGDDFRSGGREPYRLWSVALDTSGVAIVETAAPVRFANESAATDWDFAMQCYSCVVSRGADLVMFYNGNDFGRHALGWARSIASAPAS